MVRVVSQIRELNFDVAQRDSFVAHVRHKSCRDCRGYSAEKFTPVHSRAISNMRCRTRDNVCAPHVRRLLDRATCARTCNIYSQPCARSRCFARVFLIARVTRTSVVARHFAATHVRARTWLSRVTGSPRWSAHFKPPSITSYEYLSRTWLASHESQIASLQCKQFTSMWVLRRNGGVRSRRLIRAGARGSRGQLPACCAINSLIVFPRLGAEGKPWGFIAAIVVYSEIKGCARLGAHRE